MTKTDKALYRHYNINAPFYQSPFVFAMICICIVLIDFFTSRISIDAAFSNDSELMTNIIAISIVIALDVTPIGVINAMMFTIKKKTVKKVLIISIITGIVAVFSILILLCATRLSSSELMFGVEDVSSSISDINTGVSDGGIQPYQIMLIFIITVVNISTTVFGIVVSIHRCQISKQINLAQNSEELDDMKTAAFELAESVKIAESEFENLVDEEAMLSEEQLRLLTKEQKLKKTDKLAEYLRDRTVMNVAAGSSEFTHE